MIQVYHFVHVFKLFCFEKTSKQYSFVKNCTGIALKLFYDAKLFNFTFGNRTQRIVLNQGRFDSIQLFFYPGRLDNIQLFFIRGAKPIKHYKSISCLL